MKRAMVMEGSLEEFNLVSVLQTVSIGRQFTGLEFLDESGSVVGTMCVNAGQIVSATAEGLSGLDAVKSLVRTRKSRRFFVYRGKLADDRGRPVDVRGVPGRSGHPTPLGPVGEVLMRVAREDESTAEGRLLFQGGLGEFTLSDVLDALSLGRQCVGVDLFSHDNRQVGAVCVKGGQVLFAIAGKVTGQAAMDALFSAREGRFVAYQTKLTGDAEPLGSLRDVLRRSRERANFQLENARRDEDAGESSCTQVRPPKALTPPALPALKSKVSARFARPDAGLAGLAQATSPADAAPVKLEPPTPTGTHARLRTLSARSPSQQAAPDAPLDVLAALHEAADAGAEPTEVRRPSEAPRSTWSSVPAPAQSARTVLPAPRGARSRLVPVVAITSPKGGAGRTTLAVNLAVALARRNLRVVLIDADANGVLDALRPEPGVLPGVSDILEGTATLESAYLHTRVPNLRILPSGQNEPDPTFAMNWTALIEGVRADADLVLVDCPPSVYGATRAVASVASHALMVVSADPAACRAAEAHQYALRTQASETIALAGIVLNMLDYQARPSLHVFEELCTSSLGSLVMEVPVPRSSALMEASARGVPMACAELSSAPAIAYCFELLAAILLERLGISERAAFAEPLL